jgi:hypothetical protein
LRSSIASAAETLEGVFELPEESLGMRSVTLPCASPEG